MIFRVIQRILQSNLPSYPKQCRFFNSVLYWTEESDNSIKAIDFSEKGSYVQTIGLFPSIPHGLAIDHPKYQVSALYLFFRIPLTRKVLFYELYYLKFSLWI